MLKTILLFPLRIAFLLISFFMVIGLGFGVIGILHINGVISAEPVIVIMNHAIDNGLRWITGVLSS